jgi:hypothetical protein
MKEAFRSSSLGVTTATQANHDLILDIRFLCNLIKTTIHLVHGGTQTEDSALELPSPSLSDHMYATDHTPLSHIISIRHKGANIEQDLRQRIHMIEYSLLLQLKIQKDTGWSDTQFQQVAWPSFYAAIRRIPRAHRNSITKLAHNLWNTNVQNKKYYGQTDLCPICKKTAETTSHIYQCNHPSAIAIRQ